MEKLLRDNLLLLILMILSVAGISLVKVCKRQASEEYLEPKKI